MKRIMFLIFLFLSLMVCITSLGWAGAMDDAKAGIEAFKGRDYDKAIQLFTKAIDSGELSQKNLGIAYYNRGFAWLYKADYDKAIADYTKAIELKPEYAIAYQTRGYAWYKKGDYDKAISDYTKAIEIDPKHAGAYIDRGEVWVDMGKYDRAIADFTKAIELNPKHDDGKRTRHFLI
jgi:tetratricopeptide (TPR) repeat protein